MKPAFRVIARLDIKDENLVKGINFEGLRVLGKPNEFAQHYYEHGIDEIFYQDVIASLLGRNNLKEIIAHSSKNIFVQIIVGGGIKKLNDIELVLKSGADRVSINSGALENKDFVKSSIKNFGSSNIVVSIETIKINNNYLVVKYNGREKTNYKLEEWIEYLKGNGVSEISVSSVSNDGTGKGINYEILDILSKFEELSVVYGGGVNSNDPSKLDLNKYENLAGLSISSLFHYDFYLKQTQDPKNFNKGNIEFMLKKNVPKNINPCKILDFKGRLIENNINCSGINVQKK